MPDYINTLPLKQVFIYLFIGALLHFVFHVVSKYIIPVLIKKESAIVLLWQRLQIVIWVVYFTFFFSSLMIANNVLTLSISFIVITTGWSYWTNFFAGTIIKISNTLKVDDFIATELVSGRIRKINLTYTEIINKKGELIVIPNNKLNKQVIKHVNDAKTLSPFSYIFFPKKDFSYEKLYQKSLNCPYFTANQIVKIERDKGVSYLIKAMLIDEGLKEKAIAYFESCM